MRKPITNHDIIRAVQAISDSIEESNYVSVTQADLCDFIINYVIANSDDIQIMWNDSVEEANK